MPRFTNDDGARVRQATADLVKRHRLPGISVGVLNSTNLVFAEGVGYADIEARRPQDPKLRQRIGSITKTMIGLSIMALVDEGRLRLEDRVKKLLPDVQFNGPVDDLSLWHLMTHTSGIGEGPTMRSFHDPIKELSRDQPENRPIAERYPDGIDIEQAPGTHWHYQNHGFALLGEILSRAEDCPIHEALRRRIFACRPSAIMGHVRGVENPRV